MRTNGAWTVTTTAGPANGSPSARFAGSGLGDESTPRPATPPKTPVYQSIASCVAEMRERGLNVTPIAKHFRVDYRTAAKALDDRRWIGRVQRGDSPAPEPAGVH